MCQFMRDQFSSRVRRGSETARAKHNIRADCVRVRPEGARGLGGKRAGMYANLAEIVAEALLHVVAHAQIKRPPR